MVFAGISACSGPSHYRHGSSFPSISHWVLPFWCTSYFWMKIQFRHTLDDGGWLKYLNTMWQPWRHPQPSPLKMQLCHHVDLVWTVHGSSGVSDLPTIEDNFIKPHQEKCLNLSTTLFRRQRINGSVVYSSLLFWLTSLRCLTLMKNMPPSLTQTTDSRNPTPTLMLFVCVTRLCP